MINKQILKDKAISVSAIMGNKKLSSIVADGLKAPVGSSRRQKAAAILRTVNKRRLDGQGGGGYFDLMSPYTAMQNTSNSTPSMIGVGNKQPASSTSQSQYGPIQKPTSSAQDYKSVSVMEHPPTGDVVVGTMNSAGKVIFPAAPKKIEPTGVPAAVSQIETMNLGQGTQSYYDQWYSGLSETEKSKWKPLYDAVSAGVGPSTFAWQVMGDTDSLKKILPGVPEDALPVGASLTGQIKDIEDALREEYKLEQLSSNLSSLQNRGITIEDDLKGYMTTRDKYIEKLDGMIDSAKTSVVNMDMANPYVAQRMGNYMNYLYLMKGRQQKRYTDMLNSSIDYHNQELSVAKSAYDNAYSRFTNELKTKTEVTKEDYNRLKTMLEEMYENVSGREDTELKKQKLREEVLQASYQTVVDAAEASLGPDSTNGWGGLTDSQKATAESKFIDANQGTADEAADEFTSLSNAEKLKWYSSAKNDSGLASFYAIDILKGIEYNKTEGDNGSPSIYYTVDDKTGKGTIRWDKLTGADKAAVQKAMAQIAASQVTDPATKENIKSNPIEWLKRFFGGDL